MDLHDPNRPDAPLYGMYSGIVSDREDPEKLYRVRVQIPGLVEEGTAWALPLGLGGGAKARGVFFVPPLGAEVAVWFEMGDIDRPRYIGANLGRGEQLTGTDGHPDTGGIETENFLINIDDRPESLSVTLKDKASGDLIQINGAQRTITVQATAAIHIKAEGYVYIDGLEVFINGQQAGLGKL